MSHMKQMNKEDFTDFLFSKGFDPDTVSLYVIEYLLRDTEKTTSDAFHVGKELKQTLDRIRSSYAYNVEGYIDPQLKEMAKAKQRRLEELGFTFQELQPYLMPEKFR